MRLTPNPTPTISGPRNGGSISFAPILARGPQGLPGPGSAAWVAGEAVTTGAVRQAPDGSYIKSTASRTTRSSFDATEQGFWTSVGSDPTTFDGIKLAASIEAIGDGRYAVPGVDSTQRLMAGMAAELADQQILFLGDSTGNETSEWIYLWSVWFATQWPTWTVQYRLWNDTTGDYDTAVTLQTGTGSRTLVIYNASVPGFATYSWMASRFTNAVVALSSLSPALAVVSLGHNEGTTTALWHSQYVAFTEQVSAQLPGTDLLLVAQNPETANTYQQQRREVYREIAARRGYGFVDVCQAFLDTPSWQTALIADGIHPNPAGSAVWRDTMKGAFTLQRRTAPRPQQPATITQPGEDLLTNGNFSDFSGALPTGWDNASGTTTAAKNTTYYESQNGYSVEVTSVSSGDILRQILPLNRVKGRWITLTVREWVATGQANTAGRISIVDSTGSTVSNSSDVRDGFRYLTVTRFIPATATYCRVYLYGDSAGGGGKTLFDWASCVFGKYPRAAYNARAGASGATGSASVVQFDHLSTMGTMPALTLLAQTYGGIGVGGANQGILVPVKPPRDCTIAALEWYCQTPSGNYDIALLDASGTRLWSKGSTAMPTAGAVVETVSPTVALTAGTTYYVMMAFDNTTGRVRGVQGVAAGMLKAMNGSAFALLKSSVFPVPSSLTPGTTGNNAIPLVALREAA